MLSFLKEAWFWAGFFGVVGSLGGILIKELLASKAQLKVERLRLHERESLDAYRKLYNFVSYTGDLLFPPEEIRSDFIAAMKRSYIPYVKPNMLLFIPEIRQILYEFESQYDALENSDLRPKVTFDAFIDKHILKHLNSLRKIIEKQTDGILH